MSLYLSRVDGRMIKRKSRSRKKTRLPRAIGWREWVGLPELCPYPIKAKIDTGARTSSIHAFNIAPFERDGEAWVRFDLHPVQNHREPKVSCEALVKDVRVIKSSNGVPETRYVIRTKLKIGKSTRLVDLSLTDRDEMGFRMLIGRRALRRRFLVDPSKSFLADVPIMEKQP